MLEEFWETVDPRSPAAAEQLALWVHHYNWDRPHESLDRACPIDRVCQRLGKTPTQAEVNDAYDEAKERIQVREYVVEQALRALK